MFRLFLILSVLGLAACTGDTPPVAGKGKALMLMFVEQEPDIDPYPNRVLITRDFIRMDDGKADGDFLLFDRVKKIIYSVSRERENAVVMYNRPRRVESPLKLELDVHRLAVKDAPAIEGIQPRHYALMVNDKVCREVMVVPGLHPAAVQALREFRRVLATVHKGNLKKTPVDMQDPCFLADDVFAPNRVLQFGFPIQEWNNAGKARTLIDYKQDVEVAPSLFSIPKGYQLKPLNKPVDEKNA